MDERENKVELLVDGKVHDGWTGVSVTLNLDHLSGAFDLSVTDGWLVDGTLMRLPIPSGAACALRIDGDTVITGYVDSTAPSFDGTNHAISVRGRDKAGDLVDCSAEVKEFHGQTLEAIARKLCEPFGVTVQVRGDTGKPFKKFATTPGDKVGEVIEKLCRQRGRLAWSDGLGAVIIGRGVAGTPVATLERGKNVLAADATDDRSDRFSEVIVKGAKEGDDDTDSEATAQGEGRAKDPGIRRHRPLILTPETQGEKADMAKRAEWEVRSRRGKGRPVKATVQGWRHEAGLFRPGETLRFADDWLSIDGDYLLANVTFSKNEQGTLAALTLYPPEAFDILAEPEDDSDEGDDE